MKQSLEIPSAAFSYAYPTKSPTDCFLIRQNFYC